MIVEPALRSVLEACPETRGKGITKTDFMGSGLTNMNWTVTTDDGGRFVVRVPGPNGKALGIDRNSEYEIIQAVAPLGICPTPLHFDTVTGAMVTPCINGRDADAGAFRDNMPVIAGMLRSVHSLTVSHRFDPFRDIHDRLDTMRAKGVRVPDGTDGHLALLDSIRQRTAQGPQGLCHNDPFPNNFLQTDNGLYLLDWEYAGMGNPFFDLACICMHFDDAGKARFMVEYFGSCNEGIPRQLEEMEFVMMFWNATWALLQSTNMDTVDYGDIIRGTYSRMNALANGVLAQGQ